MFVLITVVSCFNVVTSFWIYCTGQWCSGGSRIL